jgi:hypothetical protein
LVTNKLRARVIGRLFQDFLLLHSNTDHGPSAFLGQQQMAPIPDRGLGDLGKSLQQQRQRHLDPDMIIRHIDMTRRQLAERADAKDHAIAFPTRVIDVQHRDAG